MFYRISQGLESEENKGEGEKCFLSQNLHKPTKKTILIWILEFLFLS